MPSMPMPVMDPTRQHAPGWSSDVRSCGHRPWRCSQSTAAVTAAPQLVPGADGVERAYACTPTPQLFLIYAYAAARSRR